MYEPLVADDVKTKVSSAENHTRTPPQRPGDVIAQIHMPKDSSGQEQPVVVLRLANLNPGVYDKYMTSRSRVLGAIQVAFGIFVIVLNVIGIVLLTQFDARMTYGYMISTGIWGGIIFCLSGSFALRSAKSPKRCPIISHMVLAIVSAAAAFALIGQSIGTLGGSINGLVATYGSGPGNTTSIAISVLLLISGLVEFVTCIWSSTLSCRVTCCGGFTDQMAVQAVAVPYEESDQNTANEP